VDARPIAQRGFLFRKSLARLVLRAKNFSFEVKENTPDDGVVSDLHSF
jgi:hypothetical protein